jgi:integrase
VAEVRFLQGEKIQLDNGAIITQIYKTKEFRGINKKKRRLIGVINGIIIDAMENLRACNCPHYLNDCSDYAAKNNWYSFSCLSCPLREIVKREEGSKGISEEVEDLFRGLMESESIY